MILQILTKIPHHNCALYWITLTQLSLLIITNENLCSFSLYFHVSMTYGGA